MLHGGALPDGSGGGYDILSEGTESAPANERFAIQGVPFADVKTASSQASQRCMEAGHGQHPQSVPPTNPPIPDRQGW